MEFDSELSLLSSKFTQAYPPATYPELMHKHGRPYTCLLIDFHDDYFICVPFRSSIGHKNAFMFTGTARSKKTKSGLDYSKIAIIKNIDYFDSITAAIVEQDEYTEMMKNLPTIVQEANDYVDTYINHINGTTPLHPREFSRKYQYSTLPYFHDIMEGAVALIKIENIYTFYCSVCAALSLWSQSYARQIRIKCINIPDI